MAREFGETTGNFGVFVENPNKIYSAIREDMIAGRGYRNITALMKDPNRHLGNYHISETDLQTPLLGQEETELTIDTEWGPFCRIYSEISLAEEALTTSPHGFFYRTQRGAIRQLLATDGIPAEWDENFENLEVKRLDEVVVTINFGWMTPNQKIRFLYNSLQNRIDQLERIRELNASKILLERSEQMVTERRIELKQQQEQPTNQTIRLELDNIWREKGGKGTTAISFRKPEVFVENLRFFARVYESLIRALHQSSSLKEPATPIIFAPTSVKKDL